MKKHILEIVCFDVYRLFKLQDMIAQCSLTNIKVTLHIQGSQSNAFIPFNGACFVSLCNMKFTTLISYVSKFGTIYYVDPDVVFFKDPEPECTKYVGCDIVFQSDERNNQYGKYQCAGHLWVHGTPASLKFLNRIGALLAMTPGTLDQFALMNVFQSDGCEDIRKYKDAKLEAFNLRLVQNGFNAFHRQWHKDRNKICIHANYLVGESAKIAALRECNGWFLP